MGKNYIRPNIFISYIYYPYFPLFSFPENADAAIKYDTKHFVSHGE